MKNFLFLLFIIPLFAGAQTPHTVKAKETLYSLARKYNVHPRELAAYNNIPVETSLVLGQVIKIPLKPTMAPLQAAPPKAEPVVKKEEPAKPVTPVKEVVEKKVPEKETTSPVNKTPVYHKVAKKETLYAISKKYSNASIADIKKWNNLTSDGLSEGTNLIVGYKQSVDKAEEKTQPDKKEAEPVTEKPIEKEMVTEVKTNPVNKKEEAVVKAVEKPEKTVPVTEEQTSNSGKDLAGGAFMVNYMQQVKGKNEPVTEKGTAGIFKSTSGWEDGKYYCLSNSIPAGTIVKVTYPATGNVIYAKVLDLIPDLRQNAGIILRLSNAATSALGVSADIFECTINY